MGEEEIPTDGCAGQRMEDGWSICGRIFAVRRANGPAQLSPGRQPREKGPKKERPEGSTQMGGTGGLSHCAGRWSFISSPPHVMHGVSKRATPPKRVRSPCRGHAQRALGPRHQPKTHSLKGCLTFFTFGVTYPFRVPRDLDGPHPMVPACAGNHGLR